MSLQEYRAFIASRAVSSQKSGFEPREMNGALKVHQDAVVRFALERGKSAAFLDTGLGKSLIELEFARQCALETGKPSLILTPLAVAGQMVREGQKFGIDARQIREQSQVGAGIMVANYERLAKLDPASFGAVVLDESSILKSYAGRTRALIQEAFKDTDFKLAATATPSPNDHTELGNHAEFLGVMRQQEMLSKWFINDTSTASQDWRLKGHAQGDFWAWVASWARCATMPSDLGGDDTGYILPEIERRIHTVAADRMDAVQDGMLFRIPEMSATSFHAEKRLTLKERCEVAVSLVFEGFRDKLAEIGSGDGGCLGSQNMPSDAGKNTSLTQPSVSAGNLRAEAQRKTGNTCEITTSPTQTSLQIQTSESSAITPPGARDTQKTQNTRNVSGKAQDQETLSQSGTVALRQHTGSAKLTLRECLKIKDMLAPFARQGTKKNAARSFTSITATPQEKSGNCSAQRATRLLESCETTQTDCDQQSPIWNAIKAEPWLVFCETNDEHDALEKEFGNLAFSVRGSDDPDEKERRILAWCDGERPILISKTKIVGFGMNFQHCRNVVFASVNFSYEAFYQGVRRVWRFGQGRTVNVHIVIADTEASIWSVINEKSEKHDEMKRRMADAMRGEQTGANRRVVYDRPLDLAFPEWVKTGE
jgi:superfamily II DNA or RNA helicase